MTVIALPPGIAPPIVCPSWCVVAMETHIADLPGWEGEVIHWSGGADVQVSTMTYPDGTPDHDAPPQIFLRTSGDGIGLDAAATLAQAILCAVEEARA